MVRDIGLRLLTSAGRKERRLDQILRAEIEEIRNSKLFDVSYYSLADQALSEGIDPIKHYLLVGEPKGIAPSEKFDPVYYKRRRKETIRGSALVHYIRVGEKKGWRALPETANFHLPSLPRSGRDRVLLILHDATRTGAPILGWNLARLMSSRVDVIVVLMNGGPINGAFDNVAAAVVRNQDNRVKWDVLEASRLVERLVAEYAPKFAVLNSAVTRFFAPDLASNFVPVVALVHEFSTFFGPPGPLELLYHWASAVVFPAQLVANSSTADYPILAKRRIVIARQGPCELPPSVARPSPNQRSQSKQAKRRASAIETSRLSPPIVDRLRPSVGEDKTFLVVGIGYVDFRKGVDLFIATAADMQRLAPKRRIRFVWVGGGYHPRYDKYGSYLNEQIDRSGLKGVVDVIGEVEELEPVYTAADLFYLSSRLDPLPNVAIDASLRGIPVIAFDQGSGMAELLQEDEHLRTLVVPYLDTHAAAKKILEVIENPELRSTLSIKIRKLGKASFDLDTYVDHVLQLGRDGSTAAIQQRVDYDFLVSLDPALFGENKVKNGKIDVSEFLRNYVVDSALFGFRTRPTSGVSVIRPIPGFNPLKYAAEYTPYSKDAHQDPLVHYIRAGCPEGPWKLEVFQPGAVSFQTRTIRAAIHCHFHYPELFSSFLKHLAKNYSSYDLFITTTSNEKAEEISETASGYKLGIQKVTVVPNKGRDIGPFILELSGGAFESYDIVGHIHGKRSVDTQNAEAANRWRNFLWQNLIGGKNPSADAIATKFIQDPRLGLVFPEDPHVIGWDDNREIAEVFAKRMGVKTPLADYFDFPVGTMFWARPQALAPLAALGLSWADFPDEPLPTDGTLLHALERLIPFIVDHSGFRTAVTELPGVRR